MLAEGDNIFPSQDRGSKTMIFVGLVIGFMLGLIAMGYYARLLLEELSDANALNYIHSCNKEDWVDAEDVFKRLGHE